MKMEKSVSCQCPICFPTTNWFLWETPHFLFPRYCRRFQGLKSVQCQAFGKARVCQECQNGQVRIPWSFYESDPVTTQLWLGRGTSATHPPLARLEPKCLESIGLINLEKEPVVKLENHNICVYIYIHMRYRYILTNPHGLNKCSVLTLGYLTKSHDPCHHLVRPRIGPMQSNNISQRDSIQYQSMLYLLYNIILYRSISTCECQVDLPKHLMILFFTQDLSQLTHDIEPALAAIDPWCTHASLTSGPWTLHQDPRCEMCLYIYLYIYNYIHCVYI